ncbi:MAG TPA: methyltransferase domain-containing protein, partial [Ilumatobacteraceae bacterium]|nr:methyltransferase domain-containing protein [Ilumatobacteraceae bacterium]
VQHTTTPQLDQPGDSASSIEAPRHGTSDYFHHANHELRTLELERVPKGATRALSVGAQGRWYFEWFERSVGPLDEHIGVEAYEDKPTDLPDYVTWVADTADHMVGVADGSVDLVFAGQTSEHLWARELSGFLTEAHRVLRSGGVLALDSPNRLVTQHLLWSHGGHTIELSAAEMKELLNLAGFEVLSVTGIWNCVIDGRIVALEYGIDNPAIFARRAAAGTGRPDDSFVWWINARRSDRTIDDVTLRARVDQFFEAHWNTRVSRGLAPDCLNLNGPLDIVPGTLSETLPFPLHQGTWTVSLRLAVGTWNDVSGFGVRIVAPRDHLIHDLPLSAATVTDSEATWTIEQPYLLFALTLQIRADDVSGPVSIRLPIEVAFQSG